MSDKTPPPQVWPTLHARDARALIDFYVRGLGFTETVTYSDDAGRVVHAELAWPHGGGIMLGSARDTSQGDAWPLRLGSFGAYAVVADPAEIDALYERAIAAGATSARAPRHRLRLPRLRRPRPRGQPLELRHLPRRAPPLSAPALPAAPSA